MKVITSCVTCMKEAAETFRATGTSIPIKMLYAEMDNNGVVYLTCDSGHKTASIHGKRKHLILFKSGCCALLDNYTNEAVSSFSAALERTYEFFIRVAYRKLGLASSLLESAWKDVSKKSERQFGAFALLFPAIAGKSFYLPAEVPELRNKVIHKGYIAQFDEVSKYAESIFLLIREIMHVLSDKCPTEMWAEINEARQKQRTAIPSDMEFLWSEGGEFDLDLNITFESWMDRLKKERPVCSCYGKDKVEDTGKDII